MSDDSPTPWDELARPPAAGIPDAGPGLLDKITADLQMDDEWIVRTPRALTWWGEALPLSFTVDEPRLVQGDPTVKLTIAMTVLTDVTARPETVLELVDQVNRGASTGALVWLEDERRIDAFLTHYDHDGVSPITHVMSAYALLFYGESLGRVQYLAEQLGGTPAIVAHPVSGVREDYDEMMTFTEQAVLPAGQEPNRWQGPELPELAEHLTAEGAGISTGGPDGPSVEYPLARNSTEKWQRLDSHHASGGNFAEDPIAEHFSMPTALQEMLCLEHPIYGSGLMSLLRFPLRVRDDGPSDANAINLGEYLGRTGVPAVGAWCTDPAGGLTQTVFISNFHHATWVAANLAYWAAARTRWAFEAFAPDLVLGKGDPS